MRTRRHIDLRGEVHEWRPDPRPRTLANAQRPDHTVTGPGGGSAAYFEDEHQAQAYAWRLAAAIAVDREQNPRHFYLKSGKVKE